MNTFIFQRRKDFPTAELFSFFSLPSFDYIYIIPNFFEFVNRQNSKILKNFLCILLSKILVTFFMHFDKDNFGNFVHNLFTNNLQKVHTKYLICSQIRAATKEYGPPKFRTLKCRSVKWYNFKVVKCYYDAGLPL